MQITIGLGIGIAVMTLLLLVVVKAKNTLVKKQEKEIDNLNQSLLQLRDEKSRAEISNAESKSKLEIFEEKLRELQRVSTEREELIRENSLLKAENEATNQMLNQKEEEIVKRLKQQEIQFSEQIKTLKLEFSELSERLLKEKSQELNNNNKESLAPFIESLKEGMQKVSDEIKDSRERSVEQKSSLDTAIRDMMARTNEIGNEATKLAEALKGKSKTQGLYGELVLTEILKNSGLKEGEHFECQVTIRDEKGNAVLHEETQKRMIPDVIVHYPDKDLIIDSKVSLTAYLEWCEAETEEERNAAAKRHIQSIKSHIKEIVTKSYAQYHKASRRETIDCVVMFIPNENALILMRETEPKLWYEAYNQKVIITSELSLFSLLKMIENYWAQVVQQRNQEKIIVAAENMLNRLGDLFKMVEDIEKAFEVVGTKFSDVKKKMLTGGQSVATSAKQIIDSGVKSAKMERRLSDNEMLLIDNEEE
ncbi:MAG: DNA recombination protein RmuC [Bacteroidales bacterium]|nr:DNA recombination protein RmuC [Bacteroidales bacterium]